MTVVIRDTGPSSSSGPVRAPISMSFFFSGGKSAMVTPRRPGFRPRLQLLEDRCVPAVFMVKNLKDGPDAAPPAGSLRAAIKVFTPGLVGTIKLTGGEIRIVGNLVVAGPGAARIAVNGNALGRIFRVDDTDNLALSSVTIRGLTFVNGTAGLGGAIASTENLTVVQCVITGNHATSPALGGGGGIFEELGSLTLRRSKVSGNTAVLDGGGLMANSTSTGLTIDRSTITGNFAGQYGGGLFTIAAINSVRNSKITNNTAHDAAGGLGSNRPTVIDRCVISGNTSLTGAGGGISQFGHTLKITRSTVSGNTALAGPGGGVFVAYTTANTVIEDCTIAGNLAASGGGVWSQDLTDVLEVSRCLITGNTALTGSGGGVFQQYGALRINNSTVSGNRSGDDGGGVYLLQTAGTSQIVACTLAGNAASSQGGGLRVDKGMGFVRLLNSTISGNKASANGGGVSTYNSDDVTLENCTVAFNDAGFDGGGIRSRGTTINLESTIVAHNRAVNGPDLFSHFGIEEFHLKFCLVRDNSGALTVDDGNNLAFGLDPLLLPLANNGGPTMTHALKKGSLAINAGSNPQNLQTDQRGGKFKRQVGLQVDIGAFERQ
jgi:parallel beta-helix repeat protein